MNFTDKVGRQIMVETEDYCVYAYHDGKLVGELTTTGPMESGHPMAADLPAEITGWEVDENYRRAGIATELVRQLVAEIGELAPAKRHEGRGGQNELTLEGYALTIHCQRLGLVYPFPDDDFLLFEDADDE